MTKRTFSLLLVAFSFLALLHPSDAFALWGKAFGGAGDDFGGISPTGGGNYLLQSLTDSFGAGKNDLLISRLNSSGAVQWTKTFGGSDDDELFATTLTEGGFFVSGTTRSFGSGGLDILWANLDSSGAPVYQKVFGGVRDESGGFVPTNDGGFIFTGESNSYGSDGTDRDILIIKINSSGNIEWSRLIHHGLNDRSSGILEISNGYILSATVENTTTGNQDLLVVKLNSSGNIVWKKLYSGSGISSGRIIAQTVDEGYLLLGGMSSGLFGFNQDILLIKLNASGDIQWQKNYGGDGIDTATNIEENPDGTLILSGTTFDLDTFSSNILLMKLASSGGIIWQKTFGGAGNIFGIIQKASDGNYLLFGTSTSISEPPRSDLIFAKLDSNFDDFLWKKTFQGSIGAAIETPSGYILTGSTDSSGAGKMDVFGITVDSNGNFPGCIEDTTLNMGTPSLTESDLSLTTTEPNLDLSRTVGTASDIALTVTTPTLIETVICAGGPSNQPDITANPGSVNFGNVNVQSLSDQTVTIRNDGTADLIIGTITSPPAPFSKITESCSGQTLASAETCTVTYRYFPTSAGASAGNSNIPSNDPDENPLTVSLTGTGVAVPTYPLNVTVNGSGKVDSNPGGIDCPGDCTELYDENTVVALRAVPAAGSTFVGWSGDCTGTGQCGFGMDAAKNVTATFINIEQFTLTVSKGGTGNGTVTSSPPGIDCGSDCVNLYNAGTGLTLTAVPAEGSTFAGWSGVCTGTGNCVVTMDSSKSATATFTQQTNLFNINLLNPSNGQEFTTCSYSNPPKFQWEPSMAFKGIELQFSLQNNFSTIPVKLKGKPGVNELQIKSSLWKKLLLLPGTQGGTVYWKVVGTKADKTKDESNIFLMGIEGPGPVGDMTISPTGKTSLPTLSWKNQCNTKFKAWFGNDPDFTKPGMKKKALSFTDTDPNDNGGAFTKGLTSGQWTAIRKLVGNVSGATIYWYVESWDGVNRHSTTGVTSFVLGD